MTAPKDQPDQDIDPDLALIENIAYLKLAESAFGFWDNEEDAIYNLQNKS
jgi:hypothetical protein